MSGHLKHKNKWIKQEVLEKDLKNDAAICKSKNKSQNQAKLIQNKTSIYVSFITMSKCLKPISLVASRKPKTKRFI